MQKFRLGFDCCRTGLGRKLSVAFVAFRMCHEPRVLTSLKISIVVVAYCRLCRFFVPIVSIAETSLVVAGVRFELCQTGGCAAVVLAKTPRRNGWHHRFTERMEMSIEVQRAPTFTFHLNSEGLFGI